MAAKPPEKCREAAGIVAIAACMDRAVCGGGKAHGVCCPGRGTAAKRKKDFMMLVVKCNVVRCFKVWKTSELP